MPMYAYKGLGPTGKAIAGLRDAESPKALRQIMRRDGIVVTDCEISAKGGAKAAAAAAVAAAGGASQKRGLNREVNFGGLFVGVKKSEIAAFTRQIATLLRSGIPLAEALGALFEATQNVRFKVPIGMVRTAVNEGTSLADALAKHPKLFDELYVSMVRAGEVAGNLDEVLGRLADFLDGYLRLRSKVQAAMVYPIIMVLLGVGIMFVLMVAVIPEITKMFAQQGKTLPINTRILINFASFVGNFWWLLLLATAGFGYLFFRWSRGGGRRTWHTWLLKMPIVGDLVRNIAVARFSRTLGTMLNAGVPMLRALDTAKQILGNVILKKAIDDAKQAVTEGESLAATLKRSNQFPSTMIHMIQVGERAGQLEEMLHRVADTYELEVDGKLTRLTSMLEPLLLVVMGVGVGFIVFSILQPILDMGTFSRPK
jgi:general secretion pathway protein F